MTFPADDPRAAHRATEVIVDRAELEALLGERHQWVLATTRADQRPQMSPVTGGLAPSGRLLVATYPERAKVRNVRRRPAVSLLALGDTFDDAWIQVDGEARVLDLPEASDGFVDYYRSISGEHPDWTEYRQAMVEQGKCLIEITPTRWGPLSTGGFPASLFEG